MGVDYFLVNFTKRECITFAHLGASRLHEIAGNPPAASITAWYMLHNRGDQIVFVSDDEWMGNVPWPFPASTEHVGEYPDRTDACVEELIRAGILEDCGFSYVDEDEPDTIYTRKLRNCYLDPPGRRPRAE